jgi:KTSC domain
MSDVRPLPNSNSGWQAGYDEGSQTLTIVFPGGKPYQFNGVPPDVWKGLQEADSAGAYYNANIRGAY